MPKFKNPLGFTLIELMITIVIIGILASIGAVVYASAQRSARIQRRVEDLKSIQSALELFKLANGRYPVLPIAGCLATLPSTFTPSGGTASNNSLVPNYMPAYPEDPSETSTSVNCYTYQTDASGTEFKIYTTISTPEMDSTNFKQQPTLIDPNRDGGSASSCTIETASANNPTAWAIYTTSTTACAY